MANEGVKITKITEGGLAHNIGLSEGDTLLRINGTPLTDSMDYIFHVKADKLRIEFERGGKGYCIDVKKDYDDNLGIELKPFRIRTCRNNCIFCFVSQLPKGMRKSLYIKDDDFRLSLLYGNYITLTNLTDADKKRIFSQRLSPLYISVHTTDDTIRRKLLGNPDAPSIMKELKDLSSNRIRMHAQVIVCPDINDGEELIRTVNDLYRFYPYIMSVAVVPVGVTKYRKHGIKPVGIEDAKRIIYSLEPLQKRFKKRHGECFVYPSDEIYIRAGLPLPGIKDYGDLHQIENGVGLVPMFLNSVKRLKLPKKPAKPRRFITVTGLSFYPYLLNFAERLNSSLGISIECIGVENRFFGPTVTVAGLLTGRDILATIVDKVSGDCLLIPKVALRDGGNIFLDDVTLKDMASAAGVPVKAIEPTPEGLLSEVTADDNR